jgi:hypothetical protein
MNELDELVNSGSCFPCEQGVHNCTEKCACVRCKRTVDKWETSKD